MVRTLLLLLCLNAVAVAQTATGSIAGTVTDPVSAVIPSAKVTLTNRDTSEKRTTYTGGQGSFLFPLLQPATYSLEVEAAGFKRFARDNVKVDVALAAVVDVKLEIGSLADQVTATGEAPLLEAGTSSLGHIIENQRIVNLPLNGRNSYGFAALVPGVRASRGFSQVAYSMANDQFLSVNGSQPNQSSFLLDGGANSAPIFNGPAFFPSVDTVQEYKVQTNNLSAEFSDTGGGVVNVVTRSGTNRLHGTLYEFLRNDKLDGNDFFANRAGRARAPYRFNQFGATAGGPVVLPGVYNGKNRTFFFGSYEGLRWVRGMVSSGTVPTLLERAGNFSEDRDASGQPILIYDPLTSRTDPDKPGSFLRSAFPNNQIPQNRFDAVAKNVAPYIGRPNTQGARFTNANNFLTNYSFPINKNEFSARIDHSFSDRGKLFGRYSRNKTAVDRPGIFGPALYVSAPVNGLDNLNQQQSTIN